MTGARWAVWVVCLAVANAAVGADVHVLEDPRTITAPGAGERMERLAPGDGSALALAAAAFVERRGGAWTFHADPRTERVVLAQGSGVALPLSRVVPDPLDPLGALAEAARAFVADHPRLLEPSFGRLVLDRDKSSVRGRLASVYFDWHVRGLPVEGAFVFVRFNSGRVTQFGSRLVSGKHGVELFPEPRVTARDARTALLAYTGDVEIAQFRGDPVLLVTPVDTPTGIDYRMVWRLRYRLPGRYESWEGRVDARTGRVVGFRDTNVYARATGGVFPRSVWFRDETRVPLPFLDVADDGGVLRADEAGRYEYRGGRVTAGLESRWLATSCSDCTGPAEPFVESSIGAGFLDFGVTGWDEAGNGASTIAGRNVYYHTHQVRRIAQKWFPDRRWLRRARLQSNVNLDLACNAFYDHEAFSVNYFRSGDGCNNTGMVADIIHHEWGHAIDFATLVLDGGTAEGTADVVALHMTRDPTIAPGFRTDGRPVRTLDPGSDPRGLMTFSKVADGICQNGFGGVSIHCIGTVYGQTAWELALALGTRHGARSGWRISERLFYASLPDAGSLDPASPAAIYAAYLQADDDDGNLANGTPNASTIHAVFARHEIAQDAVPESPACVRPAQPVVAATPRCGSVDLRWPPVPGAVRYEVLRTELLDDGPYYPVATLDPGAGRYTDLRVAPGVGYGYAVMAVDADGCESTVEDPRPVRLPERPVLSVHRATVSDIPHGNRSGFPDPGETLELALEVENVGEHDARGVAGRLEPLAPGVTVLAGDTAWPDLAPGQRATAERPLVVRLDESVPCGATLPFRFVPDDATACAAEEVSWFDVTVGAPDERFGRVCDRTPACATPPEFRGLEFTYPGESCGELRLRWLPAKTACQNAAVTYDVFRGTSAEFVPDPSNRVASGIAGTDWTDRLLTPGETYHYVVRAVDSRSGAEANARRIAAVAPGGADLRAPEFAGALEAREGTACNETELFWTPARETCSLPVTYSVYRSTDSDFVPGPDNFAATTTGTAWVDTAPEAGVTYHYAVRAGDAAGNVADHAPRDAARSHVFDRVLVETSFDPTDAGWRVIPPDDAVRGNWEWGDPEGDGLQPEHDASPDGARCWMTGLAAALPDGNNNDVDFGTTTLASARYDIAGAVDPVVRYARFFTNDRGTDPANPRDSLRVHVSADDGITWTLAEEVGGGTPLDWVRVEIPLAGIVPFTDRLRLRFTASDIGGAIDEVSKVEAGIDDFSIVDRNQGCAAGNADATPATRPERAPSGVPAASSLAASAPRP